MASEGGMGDGERQSDKKRRLSKRYCDPFANFWLTEVGLC
jgi:hypothetical protein